ncbi:MAG: PAS domain S-box protein [Pseudobdellovibrionaceae bacterium]|nr:PAS domain S-box protein [Pseudobdellovibrionaceae bacterium]
MSTPQQSESFSEKQLRAILDNTVDGIVVINSRGTVLSYNRACEKLFGYSPQEVMNKNVSMLMPKSYATNHDQYLVNYMTSHEPKVIGIGREVLGQRKNGSTFPMWLSIGEVIEGDGHFFVGIVRDLTEQREHEIDRQLYMEALEKSNKELDEFVYLISHDLKEPVRGIYSYSQFMAEDYSKILDEEGLKRLESLMKMSGRMSELIDKLLYFSRLDRMEPELKLVNLTDIVNGVIEMLDSTIQQKKVEITIDTELPSVMFDSSRISEIFYNLILNGIKYNDRDVKKINIGLCQHERAGNELAFYVKDNGIGIPEKHYDAVFKMFKRLHNREAYEGGTGAGLTIIKRIITQHGGDIWIDSKPTEGTYFYFTLGRPANNRAVEAET